MNGFLFILLLLSFQLFAGITEAQRVSLNVRDGKVTEVFDEIERQTGIHFFFFLSDVDGAKPINIKCRDASLVDVLRAIQQDQPFELKLEGETIILRKVRGAAVTEMLVPPGDISGRVTDAAGVALGGATIIIKRTGKGVQANANGEWKLSGVQEDDELVISFLGYQSKTMVVGKGQQFPVVLEKATRQLDMVVSRGYGNISNRLSVGNVATVTADEIGRTNVSNPIRAVIGKIPNVEITANAGNPYAPTKIEFRGRDLISNTAAPSPYILVDGVPMTILDIGKQSTPDGGSKGITQNGFNGPGDGQDILFNLNPDDVESITILKDAAATAIYGSLGGAGVILITTKKGKAGKLSVNVSANTGISKVTRFYEMLNTEQYIMMRKEALKNDNLPISDANAPDLLVWDTARYTDFQRYLYGRTASNSNLQVTISGGEQTTSYRINGSLSKIANVTNYSGANDKASIHSSFNFSSKDSRIKIGIVNLLSSSTVDEISFSPRISLLPPNSPAVFDSAGRLNYHGWIPLVDFFPFSELLRPYTSKTYFNNTQLTFELEILNGLKLASSFGYSRYNNTQIRKEPILSQNPDASPLGSVAFGDNTSSRWIVEPTLSYSVLNGKHKLDVILGVTIQRIDQSGSTTFGTGYVNDNLLNSISNAPQVYSSDVWGQYRYAALFSRVNYYFVNKYLLEFSARRDGSSRFGPGRRYGNFGAVGVGWIISEEPWFKRASNIFSFAKLRGSLGIVGNDNTGDYSYLSRWTGATNVVHPYMSQASYIPTQHVNDVLQWQSNKKLELGLHLGFLSDRITLQSSWYKERCGNQLVIVPLSAITGFSSINANWDAVVQNAGWEFDLRANIIDQSKLQWSFNFNLGLNRNKLLAFPGLEASSYNNSLVIGKRLYMPQLLKYTGVDPQTGLYTFEDKNKDGVVEFGSVKSGADTYFFDNVMVRYAGGFGSDLSIGGLSLNLFFSYIRNPFVQSPVLAMEVPGVLTGNNNQSTQILDRWQKPGDIARFAKFTSYYSDISYSDVQQSDALFSDGSFIRLRNISLSYTLHSNFLRKMRMKEVKGFVKGDNLLTFSKFEGIDPEIPYFGSVPTQKIVTFGLQVSF